MTGHRPFRTKVVGSKIVFSLGSSIPLDIPSEVVDIQEGSVLRVVPFGLEQVAGV